MPANPWNPLSQIGAVLRAESNEKKRRAMSSFGTLPGELWSYILSYLDNGNNLPRSSESLVRYFVEHMSFESVLSGLISERTWELFSCRNRVEIIFQCFTTEEEFRESFAQAAARGSLKRQELAKYIWNISHVRFHHRDLELYGNKFDASEARYVELLRRIHQYEEHPDTNAWVRTVLESCNFSRYFTLQDAIDTLYEGDFGNFGDEASFHH